MRGSTGEGAIFKFDDDGQWPGGLKGCVIRHRYRGNAMPPMRDQSPEYNWIYPMGMACRTQAKKEERKGRIWNEKALGEKSCRLGEKFGISEKNMDLIARQVVCVWHVWVSAWMA